MEAYSFYDTLVKPEWAPEPWLFGPVWTVLYAIIAITFGYMIYKWWIGEVSQMEILPFILNLIFNFAFTPIQFGLENNALASLDILLVLATLIWLIKVSWRKYRWVALANLPYLAWVSFATVLQLAIAYLNS